MAVKVLIADDQMMIRQMFKAIPHNYCASDRRMSKAHATEISSWNSLLFPLPKFDAGLLAQVRFSFAQPRIWVI